MAGALVGSIVVDGIANECSGGVMENLANDDDDQGFACASVVAPRTYPFDHFHVPYLYRK